MDIDITKRNLREALKLLPAGFLDQFVGVILPHVPQLVTAVPKIVDKLKGDFAVAAAENSIRMLDKDALMAACMEVTTEFVKLTPEQGMMLMSVMAQANADGAK